MECRSSDALKNDQVLKILVNIKIGLLQSFKLQLTSKKKKEKKKNIEKFLNCKIYKFSLIKIAFEKMSFSEAEILQAQNFSEKCGT